MNKRERVLAALHNQEVDYVPGCFWRHYTPEMQRGEDVVEAHLKFYRETDVDFLKISCDGFFGWPNNTLKNLTDVKQLYQMEHISADSPFIRDQIERAKGVVQKLNGECVTIYTMFAPLVLFRMQLGYDRMMEYIKADPKAVMYACNIIAEDEINLVDGLLREAGVDGIFYSVQNAEITRFTIEEYKAWAEPSDRKVLEYANTISDCNILHCCAWDADEAGTYNHLESWQEYPSAAVNWAAFVDHKDLTQIREFFNGRTAWGGFDNRVCGLLYNGTEEEIKAETRRLIAQGGKKGYILGPDCSLPSDIDSQRIKWVIEETKRVR